MVFSCGGTDDTLSCTQPNDDDVASIVSGKRSIRSSRGGHSNKAVAASSDPEFQNRVVKMVQQFDDRSSTRYNRHREERFNPFADGFHNDDPFVDRSSGGSQFPNKDPPPTIKDQKGLESNPYICDDRGGSSLDHHNAEQREDVDDVAGVTAAHHRRHSQYQDHTNNVKTPNGFEYREVVEATMQGTTHVFGERDEFQLQIAKECFDNGTNYWGNGEHDIAMVEFRRALEINEEIYGRASPETAKCYLWVGSIHWHKEEYEKALDCFTRSFRIKMQLNGYAKDNCGIVVNWIDRVLKAKREDKPNKYWKSIMTAIEREHAGDNSMQEKNYSKAITEYRAVIQLELSRRGLKANAPGRPIADVADLHAKIAQVHVAEEDYERAMMEYRQALSIYTSAFGRDQQFTNRCYKDIGAVAQLMGFRDSSINTYLESLHQCLVDETYADHYMEEKKYAEALKFYDKVMEREGNGVGRNLIQNALVMAKMGRALRKLGRKEEAIPNFCKAYGIFNDILGSEHRLTKGALKVIRETLIETK